MNQAETILIFSTHSDPRGSLVALEGAQDIPFDIKRIYYIYDTPAGHCRGFHAHKTLHQVMICLSGGVTVSLDDGQGRISVRLERPDQGLVIDRPLWREMSDFSSGTVLLVLASQHYDPQDYIRDYQEFLSYIAASQNTDIFKT